MDHLDDEAERFGQLARRFIQSVEAEHADRLVWLEEVHDALADLYSAAVHRRDVGVRH